MWRSARWAGRIAALLLPVAAAAGVVALAAGARSGPDAAEAEAKARPARVILAAPTPFVARATGYGVVAPARDWKAVARIEGAVAWMSPALKDGGYAKAGETLLRLEDADIRLALAQIDADLATLDIRARTYRDSLAIAEREQALAEAEAARQRELRARGASAQTAADQAERAAIAAASQVQTQRNLLAVNAAERTALTARRAVAERDLEHAEIVAPFDLTIGAVNVEIAQYVARGAVLFEGDGVETAEIAAEFPLGALRPLIVGRNISPEAAIADPGPLGLDAVVRLRAPGRVIEWPATVDRVAQQIGARTQSASVIVRVANNFAQAAPGARPPLRRGAFVEVELRAPVREASGVVPAAALHQGMLRTLDAEDRLVIAPAPVALRMGELALLDPAPPEGTRIVVSDLVPAVAGMKIRPREDKALTRALADLAAGRAERLAP
ncbi:efflux RND transporter periplasmic adaptor subunit [Rubrimonas sp.]|uniref:efflux RND transporter periplasmic adaptor subunit n=1 Tax=Rubrimonas sp. TaxID=2036015 RepID=UPI002FDE2683